MNRNETIQALPVMQITVRLTTASVEVFPDDIEDIHIMVSGGDHEVQSLRIEAVGQQLLIRQPAALRLTKPNAASWMQITLRTPRSWKGGVSIRTVSGPISLREQAGADLALASVSGTVTGTGLQFLSIRAHTVAGDVKLGNVQCERCSLSSACGGLLLGECSLLTANTVTLFGDTALALTEPFGRLRMASVTGDLSVDAPVDVCDAILRSAAGRVRTSCVSISDAAAKIRAVTLTSDLDVTRSDLAE